MAGDMALLVVGFVLTTVLGGALGTWFQRQTWKNQHEVQLFEKELERASDVCYSLSALMDRRLYRMVRLQAAIARCDGAEPTLAEMEARMGQYIEVLFEWNGVLNGNRAVIGTYFGDPMRHRLEAEIYVSFNAAGACIETAYRSVVNRQEATPDLDCGLQQLNELAYNFVSDMTLQLRNGTIGRSVNRSTSPSA